MSEKNTTGLVLQREEDEVQQRRRRRPQLSRRITREENEARKALEAKNRKINEEYKAWKQYTPNLYDLLITHALEWPSLTVEWLPNCHEPPGEDYTVQKVVLGTYAARKKPNYLLLAEVRIPREDAENGVIPTGQMVKLVQQIRHCGEIHRARCMPQNPSIIATKTIYLEVFVFDCSKHPSKPQDGCVNPDLRLKGHKSDGYGLSWSPFKQGYLLSGSADTQICMWNIDNTSRNKTLNALQFFKVHEHGVEDVAWHLRQEYLFGSVGDDGRLVICDLRLQPIKPVHSLRAHEDVVNSLSFNPHNEWVVATGSTDKTVKLFDLRKLNASFSTLGCHKSEVSQVCWNPENETILASSSHDRRLMVWDLSRVGEKQTPEEAAEGPPELLFIHGGHTAMITDFSWNPCQDWVVASVAKDNLIQIWQMTEKIHLDDDPSPEDEQ